MRNANTYGTPNATKIRMCGFLDCCRFSSRFADFDFQIDFKIDSKIDFQIDTIRCGYCSGRKPLISVVPTGNKLVTSLTLTLDLANVTLPNRRRSD